jgi:hypothetical protein
MPATGSNLVNAIFDFIRAVSGLAGFLSHLACHKTCGDCILWLGFWELCIIFIQHLCRCTQKDQGPQTQYQPYGLLQRRLCALKKCS